MTHAFASVHCCLVVTYWERASWLMLVVFFFFCIFVIFPCGILGQVWYLIVSFPDICLLFYYFNKIMQPQNDYYRFILSIKHIFSTSDELPIIGYDGIHVTLNRQNSLTLRRSKGNNFSTPVDILRKLHMHHSAMAIYTQYKFYEGS